MQNVSDAYKAAMAKPIRDQGYAKFQLAVNDDRIWTTFRNNSLSSWYSTGYDFTSPNIAKGLAKYNVASDSYAAMDLFKLDGSQILPYNNTSLDNPFNWQGASYGGIISRENDYTEDGMTGLRIGMSFSSSIQYSGITIVFDTFYPGLVRVRTTSSASIDTTTDYYPTSSTLMINESNLSITRLQIMFFNIPEEHPRVRILGLFFGYFGIFDNNNIETVTWKETASFLGNQFPTQDVSISLFDKDNRFNPEDESNVLYSLDAYSETSLDFGITLEDCSIEWVSMMRKGVISDWSYTRGKISLTIQDRFRNMIDPVEAWSGMLTDHDTLITDSNRTFKVKMGASTETWDQIFDLFYPSMMTDRTLRVFDDKILTQPILRESKRDLLQQLANYYMRRLTITRDGLLDMYPWRYDPPTYSTLTRDMIVGSPSYGSQKRVKTVETSYTILNLDQSSNLRFYVAFDLNRNNQEFYYDIGKAYHEATFSFYYMVDEAGTVPTMDVFDTLPTGAVDINLDTLSDYSFYCNVGLYNIHIAKENVEQQYVVEEFAKIIICIELKTIEASTTSGATLDVEPSGDNLVWNNPICDGVPMAQSEANYLKDYYTNYREYNYEYRGLLELDASDWIRYEPLFGDNNTTRLAEIMSNEITFNGAFSGKLTLRSLDT